MTASPVAIASLFFHSSSSRSASPKVEREEDPRAQQLARPEGEEEQPLDDAAAVASLMM